MPTLRARRGAVKVSRSLDTTIVQDPTRTRASRVPSTRLERSGDPSRYISDLRALLFDPHIRPHVKDLPLALLAAVSEPTEEEWKLWEELISPALAAIEAATPNQDKLSAMAWSRFWSSAAGFLVADKHGVVERWLANDRLANTAVTYLRAHQRHSPDRIADLLEPYVDAGGEWPVRLRFVMEWADHERDLVGGITQNHERLQDT